MIKNVKKRYSKIFMFKFMRIDFRSYMSDILEFDKKIALKFYIKSGIFCCAF